LTVIGRVGKRYGTGLEKIDIRVQRGLGSEMGDDQCRGCGKQEVRLVEVVIGCD